MISDVEDVVNPVSMSLQNDIEARLKQAMKAKDAEALSVFRMLRASLKNTEIEKGKADLSDEEVVEVVAREIKKMKDSLSDFEKAERSDLAEKARKEIEIVSEFMPEQLSDDEIRSVVSEKAESLGVSSPSDFGRLMGEVMKEVKGRADGGRVTAMVKDHLSSTS